jgi:dephospho-CoA kinase
MIIGITGTDGGGKGTVVDYLVNKKGYVHCSARQLLIDALTAEGLPVDRPNMRLMANRLRKEQGDDYVVAEYVRRTGLESGKNYVIESIRAYAEVETLKKHGGILWAVDADPKVRYERIQSRASESDKVTFEEFMAHEALEMNDPDPHGMQKAKVMAAADVTIMNNGTVAELDKEIEAALWN